MEVVSPDPSALPFDVWPLREEAGQRSSLINAEALCGRIDPEFLAFVVRTQDYSIAASKRSRSSGGSGVGLKVFMSTTTATVRARNTGFPLTEPW